MHSRETNELNQTNYKNNPISDWLNNHFINGGQKVFTYVTIYCVICMQA